MPQVQTKKSEKTNGSARGKRYQDTWIYEEIYNAILEQQLEPGNKLKEDELGEIFGVSRTVIRRVLLRLSCEKVIEIRPNRGAIVAALSAKEVREVFEARRIIEPGIVRLACSKTSPAQIRELRKIVKKEQRAFEKGARSACIRLSGEFHLQLAHFVGNQGLADYLRGLVTRTSLAIAQYELPGQFSCLQDDHVALIDAIEQHQEARAIELMTKHLQHCEDKLNFNKEPQKDLRSIFLGVRE